MPAKKHARRSGGVGAAPVATSDRLARTQDKADAKKAVAGFIDAIAPEWKAIALRIHENPELGLKEEKAATWLTEALTRHGFTVQRNVAKLPTAFVARAKPPNGRGGAPSVAFLSEYDAL